VVAELVMAEPEDPAEDAVTGLPEVAEDADAEEPVAEDPVADVAGTLEPVLGAPLLVAMPVDADEYGKTVVVLDEDTTADELEVPVEAGADDEPGADEPGADEPGADELEAVTGEPDVTELGAPVEADAGTEPDAGELPRG